MNKKLLNTGIIGTIVTALCCFTPALVFLFGILGLSSWLSGLDYVLLPALVVFLGITIYALAMRQTS
ncbi:MAG: mercury resistance system transport protein MerF [Nitrospinae bacterium]|nr:mercury resistance system transport protein MerF [Nitrospinota bacterium]